MQFGYSEEGFEALFWAQSGRLLGMAERRSEISMISLGTSVGSVNDRVDQFHHLTIN